MGLKGVCIAQGLPAGKTHPSQQQQVWTLSDFPTEPPADLEFSSAEYEAFKRAFLGSKVEEAWLSSQQLKRLGCRSWKQYLLHNLLANWD